MAELFLMYIIIIIGLIAVQPILSIAVNESREVSNFHAIQSAGPFDITIERTTNGSESLFIVADFSDPSVIKALKTTVLNGTLFIWFSWPDPFQPVFVNGNAHIYIRAKELDTLAFSGAGNTDVKFNLNAPTINLISSGSTNVFLSAVNTNEFRADLTGAGLIAVNGSAGHALLSAQGAGNINGNGFFVGIVEASVTGMGGIVINVKDRLSAVVTGMGSVRYRGDPQTQVSVTGMGSVTKII